MESTKIIGSSREFVGESAMRYIKTRRQSSGLVGDKEPEIVDGWKTAVPEHRGERYE